MRYEKYYERVHDAMRRGLAVIHTKSKIRYDRIIEWVSWYTDDGEHRVSVALLEKRNSARVPGEEIEILDE